nr:hypothetical protein GCM10020241_26080 [Streptoalloteichus tenebrarius]
MSRSDPAGERHAVPVGAGPLSWGSGSAGVPGARGSGTVAFGQSSAVLVSGGRVDPLSRVGPASAVRGLRGSSFVVVSGASWFVSVAPRRPLRWGGHARLDRW